MDTPKSPDDHPPEVQDAAAYATQQLSAQSNSLFPFQLKQVGGGGQVWEGGQPATRRGRGGGGGGITPI